MTNKEYKPRPDLLNIVELINKGHLKVITSVSHEEEGRGRRLDILYEIVRQHLDLKCSENCNNSPKYVLYMKTHQGNESTSVICEEHAAWSISYMERIAK
jgi:hypothetical protein